MNGLLIALVVITALALLGLALSVRRREAVALPRCRSTSA